MDALEALLVLTVVRGCVSRNPDSFHLRRVTSKSYLNDSKNSRESEFARHSQRPLPSACTRILLARHGASFKGHPEQTGLQPNHACLSYIDKSAPWSVKVHDASNHEQEQNYQHRS